MNDFEQVTEFKGRVGSGEEGDWVGFAHLYLQRCKEKLKSDNEIDIQVYTRLVELDSRLGTPAAKQLHCCLRYSLRLELIKVCPIKLYPRLFGH